MVFQINEVFIKLAFERESQSQLVVSKVHHTENELFNTSEFMYYLLKKHQNINISRSGTSHKMLHQISPS